MSNSLMSNVDSKVAENTALENHHATPTGDNSNGVETKTPDAPTWFYAENIPGTGERPEWLKEKYKSAEDQAKAYGDLEKKLGAYKGAPDEYDLSLGEEFKSTQFDKNNPVLQEFLSSAKEQGMSQESITHILQSYAKMEAINQPNLDKEMERLGVNGKQDLQILAQWASNHFTKEELTTFKSMVKTADHMKIFDKMRRQMTKADTVPTNTRTPHESAEKVRQMIHDPRYDTDSSYREEVRQKLALLMGE